MLIIRGQSTISRFCHELVRLGFLVVGKSVAYRLLQAGKTGDRRARLSLGRRQDFDEVGLAYY